MWTVSLIDSIGIKLYKSVIFIYGQSNLKCFDWSFICLKSYHWINANELTIENVLLSKPQVFEDKRKESTTLRSPMVDINQNLLNSSSINNSNSNGII